MSLRPEVPLAMSPSMGDSARPRLPALGPPPPGWSRAEAAPAQPAVAWGSGLCVVGAVGLPLASEAGLCWCRSTADSSRWMGVTGGFLPRFLEGELAEAWASVPRGPALLGRVPEASGVIYGRCARPGVLRTSWAVSVLGSERACFLAAAVAFLRPGAWPQGSRMERGVGGVSGGSSTGPESRRAEATVASSCCAASLS